jgi:hypothetical protein
MQKFYQLLTSLKHNNPALGNGAAGGPMSIVKTSSPEKVLAFTREKDNNQVVAIFNLSAQPVEVTIQLPKAGDYQEYFSGETKKLEKDTSVKLDKWGYKVYLRK